MQIDYNFSDNLSILCPALSFGSGGGGCAYGLSAASYGAKVFKRGDSKQEGTTSRGITISGAFGIAVAVSFGYTYDENGNSGLYLTVSGGGGIPTAGVSVSDTTTNAPTIYDQRGLGLSMGVAVTLVPTPVSLGAEYNMLLDSTLDYAYSGTTTNVGVGIGLPAECHGTIDYTWVWSKEEIWCRLFNLVYTGR